MSNSSRDPVPEGATPVWLIEAAWDAGGVHSIIQADVASQRGLIQVLGVHGETQHATPAEVSHGERAYQNAANAMARDDGSLARLVLDEDALQVAAALDSMHQAHDTSVIEDWRLLDNLDEAQRTAIWQALWSGLDCTWIGNCSEYSLPVSSLCGMPHFQCDAGSDYYTIMRRSLSPAQFEALMMLMNQVNAWRHQQGG